MSLLFYLVLDELIERCWQVPDSAKHKIYSEGYLLLALYRLFRFTYYGNGIYITLKDVTLPKEFIEQFVDLPLELQRILQTNYGITEKGTKK